MGQEPGWAGGGGGGGRRGGGGGAPGEALQRRKTPKEGGGGPRACGVPGGRGKRGEEARLGSGRVPNQGKPLESSTGSERGWRKSWSWGDRPQGRRAGSEAADCRLGPGGAPGRPGRGRPTEGLSAAAGSRRRRRGPARGRRERPGPGTHLQHHLHVVRVPLALLVAAELGAAVEQTSSHAGLLGVDGRRRDERGGRSGRGTGRRGTLGADRHRGVPRSQGWGRGRNRRRRRAGAEEGGRGQASARVGREGSTCPPPADRALRPPPGPRDLRAGPPGPERAPSPPALAHTPLPIGLGAPWGGSRLATALPPIGGRRQHVAGAEALWDL